MITTSDSNNITTYNEITKHNGLTRTAKSITSNTDRKDRSSTSGNKTANSILTTVRFRKWLLSKVTVNYNLAENGRRMVVVARLVCLNILKLVHRLVSSSTSPLSLSHTHTLLLTYSLACSFSLFTFLFNDYKLSKLDTLLDVWQPTIQLF